jgi:hypothetical protein
LSEAYSLLDTPRLFRVEVVRALPQQLGQQAYRSLSWGKLSSAAGPLRIDVDSDELYVLTGLPDMYAFVEVL